MIIGNSAVANGSKMRWHPWCQLHNLDGLWMGSVVCFTLPLLLPSTHCFFFGKLPAVTLVKNSSPWPTWKHLSSDTTGRYPQVPMVWPLPHSGFPAKLSPLRHGCLYPFSGPSPSRSKSHCRSPLVWIFEEDKLVMYAFACIGCQVPAVSKTNKNSMKNSG